MKHHNYITMAEAHANAFIITLDRYGKRGIVKTLYYAICGLFRR